MFDALVHGRVDTEGLTFQVSLEDVEALNKNVLRGAPDISKVSFATWLHAAETYELLDAGCALGHGAGPLVVCRKDYPGTSGLDQFAAMRPVVAIPGAHTTADLLFRIYFPSVTEKREFVFSEIEDAVLSGTVDAGVIIHEGRFTYAGKGLACIADLGTCWEKETGLPIHLGGIVVRRSLPEETRNKIQRVLARSVRYALDHPEASRGYVRQHAQELSQEVIDKHIALYVNDFSKSLGSTGRKAIRTFVEKAARLGLIDRLSAGLFEARQPVEAYVQPSNMSLKA